MQQSEFFSQLESSTSVSRTPKDGTFSFTSIDNRAIHLDRKTYGLKRGDKEIHHILLSLPDDWNLSTVAHWLKNKEGFSLSTSYRVLARLEKAGMAPRAWHQKVRENTRQVFEVPCADRPQGADAKKRHVVKAVKACHKRYKKGNPRLPKVQGNLTGVTSAEAFSDRSGAVSNLTLLQRTKHNVLHSSEHYGTLLAPEGASEFSDDRRVKSSTDQTSRGDKPTRRAKRRKGRKSPAKPHNERKAPRMTRAQINLLRIRPEADVPDFMANLTTRLQPALDDLRSLPRSGTAAWVERVKANPLLAVAFENAGLDTWSSQNLRRFVKMLGSRLDVSDVLLHWIAENTDQWGGNVPFDMRSRLERDNPTKPDIRRNEVFPDLMEQDHVWESRMDGCREWMIDRVTSVTAKTLEGVDLNDPASIAEHPLVWTAILQSPHIECADEIDPEVVKLARETLIPASVDELRGWIDMASKALPCRWWRRWCKGEEKTFLFATGIEAATGEALPDSMVDYSLARTRDYHTVVDSWSATVPLPFSMQ